MPFPFANSENGSDALCFLRSAVYCIGSRDESLRDLVHEEGVCLSILISELEIELPPDFNQFYMRRIWIYFIFQLSTMACTGS